VVGEVGSRWDGEGEAEFFDLASFEREGEG
jgi:hypothetical protein